MSLKAQTSGTVNYNWGDVTILDGLSTFAVYLRLKSYRSYSSYTNFMRKDGTLNIQQRSGSQRSAGAIWKPGTQFLQSSNMPLLLNNEWCSVVFNQTSAGSLTVYSDDASFTVSTSTGSLTNSANSLYFLGKGDASEVPYDSAVADFAVWDSPLTHDEVMSLSKGFKPYRVSPSTLICWIDHVRVPRCNNGGIFPVDVNGVDVHPHPRVY